MKFDEINPTLSESRQGNLLLDIEHWHNSAKSIDEIVSLASEKYNTDVPRDYVEQAIMMSGDESSEELNEVKMTTNVFDKFIDSPEAEGIAAGFEAELYFQNIGASEIDYDVDDREEDESENRRPRSIDDICSFFHDGDYNNRRDIESLREALEYDFHEWQSEQMASEWDNVKEEMVREYIEANDFAYDDELEEYLSDTLELDPEQIEAALLVGGLRSDEVSSSEQPSLFDEDNEAVAHYAEARDAVDEMLEERIQDSIRSRDRAYDTALEEWEEQVRDEYSESDWLEGAYDTMMDVYHERDIQWPYWTYSDSSRKPGYSLDSATGLANDLKAKLGVNTIASEYYHQHERKPGLWIFEPDGSLTSADDEDDMPVEIISPPMPLKETLAILPKFYEWAKYNDAYSNETTGFHVGVSLPDVGGEVDYMKLALFLGDKYVLDKFDRYSNSYCKSAVKKIRADVESGRIVTPEKIAQAFDKMKSNLIELANAIIADDRGSGTDAKSKTGHGHGKMTSINMKGKYIEFRSMGNEHYFSKPESLANILDTIKRYAYAMYIAGQPDLYRDEYAKKLYKLLDKTINNDASMKEFADYVAGIGGKFSDSDVEKAKRFMIGNRSDRYNDSNLPDRQSAARTGYRPTGAKYWWNVRWDSNRKTEVVASNKREAREVAAQYWGVPVEQLAVAQVTFLRPFKDSPGGIGNWAIMVNGQQVFRVTASNHDEAKQKAREWIASTSREFRDENHGRPFEVVPVEQAAIIQRLLTP